MYSEWRCIASRVARKPVIIPIRMAKNIGIALAWLEIRRAMRPATHPKITGKTRFPKNVALDVSLFISLPNI